MKERIFLAYDNTCGVKIEVPVSRAIRDGKFAFCCGQDDMGPDGYPQIKNDLKSQTSTSVKLMEDVFKRVGTSLKDLIRLQVHYINDGKISEAEYQSYFESLLPKSSKPLFIFTPLPYLFYEGLVVEIDGIVCLGAKPKVVDSGKSVECEMIEADELIFFLFKSKGKGTKLKTQIEDQFARLQEKLTELSIKQEQILKIYTYYAAENRLAALNRIATFRNSFFNGDNPPCSDVPVEVFNSNFQGEEFRLEVVLARPKTKVTRLKPGSLVPVWQLPFNGKTDLAREANGFVFFATHHPYNENGELIFPGQIADQTRYCMDNLKKGLEYFGLDFSDMMKMTTFYKGSEEDFHKNLSIRNSYLRNPGAASTGVPLENFPYQEQLIQIEGIGCAKSAGLKIKDLRD